MSEGLDFDIAKAGFVIVDLQNDFIHPKGAYARGGATSAAMAALPARIKPVVEVFRAKGGLSIATQFTLVPGRGGAPLISPHLKALRPFLKQGDFAPGSWGQALVDALAPADVTVEKVNYSAFYMSRLEWVLRKLGIETLVFAGIVTNGGVASTVRDAHVRDFRAIVLSDGCASFDPQVHETALAALKGVATPATCAQMLAALEK